MTASSRTGPCCGAGANLMLASRARASLSGTARATWEPVDYWQQGQVESVGGRSEGRLGDLRAGRQYIDSMFFQITT